jgi:hypothetical protein
MGWQAPAAAPRRVQLSRDSSMTPALTRRGLLRAGGLAGAATVVSGRPWAPPIASAATAPSPLLRSSYTSLRSKQFSVDGVGLTLVSVSDLPAAATVKALAGAEEAFSLILSGPTAVTLAAGIHTFRNRELGTFELFVAPVQAPAADQLYEVVVFSWTGHKLPVPPKRPRRDPVRAKPPRPRSVVRRVVGRRLKRGMRCRLVFAEKSDVKVVSVWLKRGKNTVAADTVHHVRGRDHVAIKLRTARRLRNGHYTLLVQTREHDGAVAIERKRVTLR